MNNISIYILYGSASDQFHSYMYQNSIRDTFEAAVDKFNELLKLYERHIIQVIIDHKTAFVYNYNMQVSTIIELSSEFTNALFYEEVLDL